MTGESALFAQLARALASYQPRVETDSTYAEAAVALVCVPDPDAILLIRRAERHGDPWSGQMGLPGGRRGPEDQDLLATAIRETREEVGLDLARRHLLGGLDDLTPTTAALPRVMVRPYVFQLERRPDLLPNAEVAFASWVEVAAFRAAGVYDHWEVEALGYRMRRPGYQLSEGTVWGLTERILTPFFAVLTGTTPESAQAASGAIALKDKRLRR
jgi:8-oxo-dGTP pyrophosphatase MutT (NUDIX family)